MSGKEKVSLYQEQKKTKPKIEEIIETSLDGELKEAALDFLGYIKSFKMTPQWASANSWAVSYKGKRVCYIKVDSVGGSWYIRPSVGYENALFDYVEKEGLKEVILDNLHYCGACGRCAPGRTVTLWGKDYEGICHGILLEFHDPGVDALDCAKKLVVYQREAISGNS